MVGPNGSDPFIEQVINQMKGDAQEIQRLKTIFTIVFTQIYSALLAVEYQHGLDDHLANGGDPQAGFNICASRAYGTAKQKAVEHMSNLGYGIGIKEEPKIQT